MFVFREDSPASLTLMRVPSLLPSMMTLAVQSTSALTFNVVGHLKTFFIIGGGVLFFGDFISVQKALSLILAFTGIGWYSYLKLNMSGKL